jgi:hypothetical protein
MPSAHEIALDVLRSFGPNVVARRHPLTYGQYAAAIGRDPAEYGLAIGKAMHAIGALCVVRQIPVAPLYWVRRANGEDRGIFESDPLERHHIVESGDINTMYVVAREYQYSASEFEGLEAVLKKFLASGNGTKWSPHEIWHLTFNAKPKESNVTYYEQAMSRYRALFEQIKAQKAIAK